MTIEDLKLNILYVEDNGWSKLWFYGLKNNKWIIFDPEMSGTLEIVPFINDDGFDENPPKIEKNKDVYRDIIRWLFR